MRTVNVSPYLVCLFLGGLLPLGFSPFDWWWLSLISVGFVPWMVGNSGGFFRGWAYGTGVYTVGVSWIYMSIAHHTTAGPVLAGAATLLLCISLGLFYGLFGLLHQHIPHQYRSSVVTAGLWVAFEWLRSWLLTGFPWLYLGYSASESFLFRHWIPVVGVYGCSFVIAIVGIEFIQLIRRRLYDHKLFSIGLLLSIGLIVTNFMLNIQWTTQKTEGTRIALIQGNIPQQDKWNPDKASYINERYFQLTNLALQDSANIIFWPEAALPHLYSQAQQQLEDTRHLLQLQDHSSHLITGILTDDQPDDRPHLTVNTQSVWDHEDSWPDIRNSVILLGTKPEEDQFYHKQRLVPFGEYLPMAKQLVALMPFLSSFRHGIHPGSSGQQPFEVQNHLLQPLICYEIAFPALAFQQAWHQSKLIDAIVTLSNDGWFGLSHGPWQHFQMAQFRAQELGRPVIRVTNTGITGVIEPDGSNSTRLQQQQIQTLFYSLKKRKGFTPFSKIGPNLVLIAIGIITVATLIFSVYQRRWKEKLTKGQKR